MTFDFSKHRTRAVENAIARLFEPRSEARGWRTPLVGVPFEEWVRVVLHDSKPDTGERAWSGRQGARRDSRSTAGGDSMASTENPTVNEHVDEVDIAAEATPLEIDRLVQLLASEEDDVVSAAMKALDALGARAIVGPLTAALPRADADHRGFIVSLLGLYCQEEKVRALQALHSARESERDPGVAELIADALVEMGHPGDAP